MGMFDTLIWDNNDYQTKDLECFLNTYKIEDGLLWVEGYDIEDRSDPTARGMLRFAGMITRVNKRWIRSHYSGSIVFYDLYSDYVATFHDGELVGGPRQMSMEE